MTADRVEGAALGTIRLRSTLRPRAFGEILDLALESLRRDLGVIAAASLLVNAPLAACVLGLVYGVHALGPEAADWLLPLAMVAAVLTLARPVAQAAVAVALARRVEEDRAPLLAAAYATALKRSICGIL